MELRGGVAYGYSLPRDIGSMWISRWESATLEDRTRNTSLWTVTMYGRPLKTAAGSARPRRVSLWCG